MFDPKAAPTTPKLPTEADRAFHLSQIKFANAELSKPCKVLSDGETTHTKAWALFESSMDELLD